MFDTFKIEGKIAIRTIPDAWSDEEFAYWWSPSWELDDQGKLYKAREPRLSDAEKDRLFPVEYAKSNLIQNAAFTQILTYCSVATASTAQNFFQMLSIGTTAITGVTRNDSFTAMGELLRKAPASYNPVGTQSTVSTNLAAGDAVATWASLAVAGNGATTTLGTGTMFSHALASFVKGNVSKVVDWIFVLSN